MRQDLARILNCRFSKMKRIGLMREYFKAHPEEKKFYEAAYGVVTKGLIEMGSVPKFLNGTKLKRGSFNREFALACIAAKQALMTPQEYIRTITGKRPKGRLSAIETRYCDGKIRTGYSKGKHVPEEH